MRVNLWDTRFYIGEMSNADDILKEWEPYLQDDSYISDSMWTMAETKSSIRNEKNKELPWNVFFESVRPHMNTFLESLDPQVPYNVFCDEMWFNKYEKGDYQEPHDHAFPGRGISVLIFK